MPAPPLNPLVFKYVALTSVNPTGRNISSKSLESEGNCSASALYPVYLVAKAIGEATKAAFEALIRPAKVLNISATSVLAL